MLLLLGSSLHQSGPPKSALQEADEHYYGAGLIIDRFHGYKPQLAEM